MDLQPRAMGGAEVLQQMLSLMVQTLQHQQQQAAHQIALDEKIV